MTSPDLDALGRESAWDGVRALVAGLGVSGFAAADSLTHLGAHVTVVDDADSQGLTDKATLLEILGAEVRLGPGSTAAFPSGIDVVVTSPSWRPDMPLLVEAAGRGLAVWGEAELAWRLRGANPAPWLAVAGTRGRSATVSMLDAILRAEGLNSAAVGHGRIPLLEAVMNPDRFDVLAVELSSFQLHWSSSISAAASAVVNVGPDHLDWHGSAEAYAAATAKIYEHARYACVYNVQEPATENLVREADVVEGCRAIGITLGIPAPGMIGLVDDAIADRAFIEARSTAAAELCSVRDLTSAAPQHVVNALAAAALARSHGVSARAVRAGLSGL